MMTRANGSPFLAMVLLLLLLLLPTIHPFYISTCFIERSRNFQLKMAKLTQQQPPTSTQRTRQRRYKTWAQMIRRLEEYHAKYGHSRVSPSIDPQLHRWTIKLRNNHGHQYRDPTSTKGPRLSSEKLQALERLDFSWNFQNDTWKRQYQELCDFETQHGHCRVPIATNRRLAVWANNQRRFYRQWLQGKNTTLTKERIDMLEQISFFQDFYSYDELWDLRMEQLVDFYKQYNHSNVPAEYAGNFSLGQWVMNLRTQYKRYQEGLSSILTPSRIEALQELDFCWNMNEYRFQTMLQRLQRHSAQHNGTLEDLDDDLHIWVITQRHLYKRKLQNRTSSMTDARIGALQDVPGFVWQGRSRKDDGPSVDDWAKLFEGIRQKGITPDVSPKEHWFQGQGRDESVESKEVWTEEDLLELWNQEA